MHIELKKFSQKEWNNFVSNIDGLSLMQTWEFGEVKAHTSGWNVCRTVFKENDDVKGFAQAMIRKTPFLDRGLVWINRGPLIKNVDPVDNLNVYSRIFETLKNHWVTEKKMYLLVAPPLSATDENEKMVLNSGFSKIFGKSGWASDMIDLSYSEETLRKGLKQKWRNCLNKAERLDVTYEIASSESLMVELLDDYEMLLKHKGFNPAFTAAFLRNMQTLLPDERKMLILAGRKDGKKLGSILIANYCNTCIYLVGATNENGRKANANHFLLWSAICEMKKRGFRWFDLGGVHPENTPQGILRFKRGLNGEPYQLLGTFEAHKQDLINRMIKRRIESFIL